MTLKPYVAKVWVRVRILPAHLLLWQRYLPNGHLVSQTYHSRRFLGVNRCRINQETFVGQRIERELESGVRAPVLLAFPTGEEMGLLSLSRSAEYRFLWGFDVCKGLSLTPPATAAIDFFV